MVKLIAEYTFETERRARMVEGMLHVLLRTVSEDIAVWYGGESWLVWDESAFIGLIESSLPAVVGFGHPWAKVRYERPPTSSPPAMTRVALTETFWNEMRRGTPHTGSASHPP